MTKPTRDEIARKKIRCKRCPAQFNTWEGFRQHVISCSLAEAKRQSDEFRRAHIVTQKFLRETEFTI